MAPQKPGFKFSEKTTRKLPRVEKAIRIRCVDKKGSKSEIIAKPPEFNKEKGALNLSIIRFNAKPSKEFIKQFHRTIGEELFIRLLKKVTSKTRKKGDRINQVNIKKSPRMSTKSISKFEERFAEKHALKLKRTYGMGGGLKSVSFVFPDGLNKMLKEKKPRTQLKRKPRDNKPKKLFKKIFRRRK